MQQRAPIGGDAGFRAGEAVVDGDVRGGMPGLVHGQPEGGQGRL